MATCGNLERRTGKVSLDWFNTTWNCPLIVWQSFLDQEREGPANRERAVQMSREKKALTHPPHLISSDRWPARSECSPLCLWGPGNSCRSGHRSDGLSSFTRTASLCLKEVSQTDCILKISEEFWRTVFAWPSIASCPLWARILLCKMKISGALWPIVVFCKLFFISLSII